MTKEELQLCIEKLHILTTKYLGHKISPLSQDVSGDIESLEEGKQEW